jgi:hypothetical protein
MLQWEAYPFYSGKKNEIDTKGFETFIFLTTTYT